MVELNELIRVYENTLSPEICDFLISFFEELSNQHERLNQDGKPNLTQLNLTHNRDISTEVSQVHNLIIKKIFEYRNDYYEFVDRRVFPQEHAFEQFYIKKYNSGGEDWFDTHVDVTDYSSARRFLSFMWFLNDVKGGGNVIFNDLNIIPQKGKLIVFPSFWLYPHREESPVTESKYILSAYLHYK